MKMKGFRYFIEDEKLLEYQKMSIEQRLNWLYAANKLRNELSKRIRKIQDKFRRAEI